MICRSACALISLPAIRNSIPRSAVEFCLRMGDADRSHRRAHRLLLQNDASRHAAEANYVLLAPPAKVCNPEFLAYSDRYFTVVRDNGLVRDLFPYQRYFGDCFMALRSFGEEAAPWSRAAAHAQVEWTRRAGPRF